MGKHSAVCPAPAGMSPPFSGWEDVTDGLPRTCGDEPDLDRAFWDFGESAPHLRG